MPMPRAESLSIKARSHNYTVRFVESAEAALSRTIRDGDFLLIDTQVADLFPSLTSLSDDAHTIWINPSEKQKSFESLTPILHQLITNGIKRENRLVAVGGELRRILQRSSNQFYFEE